MTKLQIYASILIILFQFFILHPKAMAQTTKPYIIPQYHIDSQGYFYFNILNNPQGIIATRLDLRKIYPNAEPFLFPQIHYKFENNKINLISYQGPAYVIDLEQDNQKLSATYYRDDENQTLRIKKSLPLDTEAITFEQLDDFEDRWAKSNEFILFKMETDKLPMNHWLFYTTKHDYANLNDFFHTITYQHTKEELSTNYEKVKQVYLLYLKNDPNFYKNTHIIMAAVQQDDLSFIQQMQLKDLNTSIISEINKQTYHYYKCTPLGQAIRIKRYEITQYLLEKGAKLDNICTSTYSDSSSSALQLAEETKDRKMIKLIQSYLSKNEK